MILLDFRNWLLKQNEDFVSNEEKDLLQKDFDTLCELGDFKVLDIGKINSIDISSLFFENNNQIAVSPIKNISHFFSTIDEIIEIKDKEVIDYTEAADEGIYFYGQNSLVVHFKSEIALCGINNCTDESLFEEYCEDFELTPFSFDLSERLLTSDIAFFIENTLLICLDYITDKKTKKDLFSFLKLNGINIITLTKNQVGKGVLNMMYVNKKLVMTEEVNDLLTELQREELSKFEVTIIAIPFLEKNKIKLRDVLV